MRTVIIIMIKVMTMMMTVMMMIAISPSPPAIKYDNIVMVIIATMVIVVAT